MRHTVHLAPHDPAWARRFVGERKRLLSALDGLDADVHHIGSTAVPGILAKPIIDIMVALPDMGVWRRVQELVGPLGYRYHPNPDMARQVFTKGDPRTHHLHLVEQGTWELERHLVFRDALRDDPDLANRYEALKRRLERELGDDPTAYTEAKTSFIETAVEHATSPSDEPSSP